MGKLTASVQALSSLTGLRGNPDTGTLTGTYRGYTVVLSPMNRSKQYQLLFSIQSPDGSAPDPKIIRKFPKSSKAIAVAVTKGFQVIITARSKMNSEKNAELIHMALDESIAYFLQNGYRSVCQICGEQKDTSGVRIGSNASILCQDCYEKQVFAGIQRQQQQDTASENIVGGIVGALLGSLIGVAVIVILGQLGYVAVVSGIVMGVCTLKGYELLGNKLSKKSIVICVLIMTLMVWVGNRLDWTISLQRDVFSEDTIFTVFRYLDDGLKILEAEGMDISGYHTNLVMQYIFCAFGAISMIITTVRNAKRANTAEKL